MYKNRQKHITGWKAGWAASRVTLRLSGSTATRPGRRLTGDELEQAKIRLLAQYRPNPQPVAK
jgi:hypothetical protein